MRATKHNGRVRKSGEAYSPKHNDRRFDTSKADNIDAARTRLNRYWAIGSPKWYGPDDTGKPSFEAVEREYYEAHFTAMYEASKQRSKDRGQLKRVKPFEEWRKARQFVPEESFLQIGSVADGTVDVKTFKSCGRAYMKALNEWNRQNGRPFTILDAAYHFDEEIPQLHLRWVWHSVNPETGIDEIGQAKALERAGVALPDPLKPVGKDNNRKMTFDREMREKWLEICKSHGLDIETVPEKGRKHNQSKDDYIREKQDARAAKLDEREKKVEEAEKKVKDANEAYATTYFAKAELEREIGDMTEYQAWKAAKAAREAQEAQEAARKEQEAQEAKARQEAAQKAKEAQERKRQEQEAGRAAQVAQEDVKPEEPPKQRSALADMLSRIRRSTPDEPDRRDGPDLPGL